MPCRDAGRVRTKKKGRPFPDAPKFCFEECQSDQNFTSAVIVKERPRGSATRGSHELPDPVFES